MLGVGFRDFGVCELGLGGVFLFLRVEFWFLWGVKFSFF